MIKLTYVLATLVLLLVPSHAFSQTTIITNINGYTVKNNSLVKFSAIQFTNDKIDNIFSEPVTFNSNTDITVIDGKGKIMLPGLIDAHGHVLSYGQSLAQVDLVGVTTEKNAVLKVVDYANENKNQVWIKGRGWNQTQWPSNSFPSAKALDKYFPDQPVWLSRVDGHAGWANSKAMAMAGINKNTQSPSGGEIIKDLDGHPTGVFIDNAMLLIEKHIAPLTLNEQKTILTNAMKQLASLGLTSVHDAGIDTINLNAYRQLANENKMPIRINAMLYLPTDNWQETLALGKFSTTNDMLQFNSVKIQADGALGSRGAALIEDYSDKKGHRGLLLHDNVSLEKYINTAMSSGFQVNTHAIGDNANKLVLDQYQQAIKKSNTAALRHRVEHAQILRLVDIPRFEQLNVIASMQATHATSDKNMAQDRVGPDRIKGAYAWRKLLNANAKIAAGSDFPVESPNPFFGLHASVTRQDKQNLPDGGWFSDEKMTRLEALRTFTLDAAYSGHQESIIGSLEQGKKADFILLPRDLFTIDEKDIWQLTVDETWVNGVKIYHKN